MAQVPNIEIEDLLKQVTFDPYDQPFDATKYLQIQPGQQATQAQIRNLKYQKIIHTLKGKDTLIFVLNENSNDNDPVHCVKSVPAHQAANMLIDKKARMPLEDEIEKYTFENTKQQQDIKKKMAQVDLGKAIERVMRD